MKTNSIAKKCATYARVVVLICVIGVICGSLHLALPVAISAEEPLPAPFPKDVKAAHRVCEHVVVGPSPGTARSLICDLAGRPAALVYVREFDPAVEKLLARLDIVAMQGKAHKMTSSCVFLTDKEADKETLRQLAKRDKLGSTILTTHPTLEQELYFGGGGRRFSLQKEAVVTVVVFQKLTVQSSWAFRKGELTDRKISEIVSALGALLPPMKI